MTDEIEVVEIDLSEMKAQAVAEIKAELKADATAQATRQQELDDHAKAALATAKAEWEAEKKAWGQRAPAFNQRQKQSENEETDEFLYWMKTGAKSSGLNVDESDQKALAEGTNASILVPDDYMAQINSRRDQIAWTRNIGMTIIQTGLDYVDFPVEDAMSSFSFTGEAQAYNDTDPVFGNVGVKLHKATALIKVSDELLADNQTNLEGWWSMRLGDRSALLESEMVAVGTGTSQPEGVFVGGTAGLTFDSTGNITPDEIPELFALLNSQYRQDGVWLTSGVNEAYLRGIRDTSNWAFDYQKPQNLGINGDWKYDTFYGGRPIVNESNVASLATGNKVIMIGNFAYYVLVERAQMSIKRNDFLYMANGQVGFFASLRFGGAVLQAEAFQYGTMA